MMNRSVCSLSIVISLIFLADVASAQSLIIPPEPSKKAERTVAAQKETESYTDGNEKGYVLVTDFFASRAVARSGRKYAIIDEEGNILTAFKYDGYASRYGSGDVDMIFQGDTVYIDCYGNEYGSNEKRHVGKYMIEAQKGNSEAQERLAKMYYYGNDGCNKDMSKAFEWFTAAAGQDNQESIYFLARMYEHGQGVEKSLEMARDYYLKYKGDDRTDVKERLMKISQILFAFNASFENGILTVNGIDYPMVHVRGGLAAIGSFDKKASFDERPMHSFELKDYYIGKFEVSMELWRAVMGKEHLDTIFAGRMNGDNMDQCAVAGISWEDCQIFLSRLNQVTGLEFKLPTEEQWEYAAGGGRFSHYYRYSGSDKISDVAWYKKNSDGVAYVGRLKPNELGIYDMSGNVWEWCSSRYTKSYSDYDMANPSEYDYVCRGGCILSDKDDCRISNRSYASPDVRRAMIGLRICL